MTFLNIGIIFLFYIGSNLIRPFLEISKSPPKKMD